MKEWLEKKIETAEKDLPDPATTDINDSNAEVNDQCVAEAVEMVNPDEQTRERG